MNMRDPMMTPVGAARIGLAGALRDELVGYAKALNAEGCPPVTEQQVRDLFAHLRKHGAPELDEHAARSVRHVLDLGWRPAT